MHRFKPVAGLVISSMASAAVYSQTRPAATPAVIYEGARLIIGSATTPPIAVGAFVVQDGKITAIGAKGAVMAPAGATHVDLTGKTVMPALINGHAHFGYTTVEEPVAASQHYSPQNLYDQFQREAFYGVGTVNDGGTAVLSVSLQFQADQKAGKYPNAAQYVFNIGVVPPEGGPDEFLIKGTRPLHANYEVITSKEARAAVQEIAGKGVPRIKIWVGDRNGTYPAMPHEVYDAVIDEAHKHNMRVHAHAMLARDQKDILRAGADWIVHIVTGGTLDDEEIAIIKEKRPFWTPTEVRDFRREQCDPFMTQILPAKVVANTCKQNASPANQGFGGNQGNQGNRDENIKANFMAMRAAGARILIGTDAGIRNVIGLGPTEHSELAAFVDLGMSPAEAIEAGTALPAAALGLQDVGTLAGGNYADFLVLNANPLDDIKNTRQISAVYLRGAKVDREAMMAKWQKTGAQQ
jgi:imidazolonepropionase-like amidohydrolase